MLILEQSMSEDLKHSATSLRLGVRALITLLPIPRNGAKKFEYK